MKNIFTFFLGFAICALTFAQAPQKFNYQGVARGATGKVFATQLLGFKLSVLQGSSTGTPVYVETQSTTSDSKGIFSLEVGGGTIVSGVFSSIGWGANSYWLKTEMDTTGGSNYQFMGSTQMISVPYALHSVNGVHGKQRFTSSGTFTVPAGVYVVWVSMCGGGGGGGGGGSSGGWVGGGGGGADAIIAQSYTVTPTQTITVTVGNGGTGGAISTNGNAGGTSSFGTLITVGGGGGTTSVGNYNVGGVAGGSGGAMGSTGVEDGSGTVLGGAGGGCLFGSGGGATAGGTGANGGGYGGGGSGTGGISSSGGNGSAGFVLVEW